MGFSEKLKRARAKKGYSQSDLAKKVNLHYVQIGRYENNKSQPTAEVLYKLADALDVNIEYLLSEDSPSNRFESSMDNGTDLNEVFSRYKKIMQLPDEKRSAIIEMIDAYIHYNNFNEKLEGKSSKKNGK